MSRVLGQTARLDPRTVLEIALAATSRVTILARVFPEVAEPAAVLTCGVDWANFTIGLLERNVLGRVPVRANRMVEEAIRALTIGRTLILRGEAVERIRAPFSQAESLLAQAAGAIA